ncbi:hypothetical protein [Streptomyces sp. NPDC058656]|uniref:hypothetical protein n=1 Tax=Streptomyces sp. NPDC058656 TaxID=3346578 RepID=UPI00365EB77E
MWSTEQGVGKYLPRWGPSFQRPDKRRLLVVPAVAAVELNKIAAVNQRQSRPQPYPYSGVRCGRSSWGKRPAHSATGPGYCASRTGLTPAMAVAHDLTRRATLA